MGIATSQPRQTVFIATSVGLFGAAALLWHRQLARSQLSQPHLATQPRRSEEIPAHVPSVDELAAKKLEDDKEAATSATKRAWVQGFVKSAAEGDEAEVRRLLAEAEVGKTQIQAAPLELINTQAELSPVFPNVTAAFAASMFGHVATLKLLLTAGANPDLRSQKATQWDGEFTLTECDTSLVVAARNGHYACVEVLLNARADPNVQCDSEYFEGAAGWGEDDDGTETMIYSALDAAGMARQTEIADLIQRHGGGKLATLEGCPARKTIGEGSCLGQRPP